MSFRVMRVLAIDTALGACSAAVFDVARDALLASESHVMARGHAEALMPLIARVMRVADMTFSKVDRIAVTVGPGSFTGLRVGISAARGIALASGKRAVGISTLSAFAAPCAADGDNASIIAAIDASHGNVYLQVFESTGMAAGEPRIATIEDAARAVATGTVSLVGTASVMVAAAWPADKQPPLRVETRAAPDIAWVARLGTTEDPGVPPKPLYLRAPDARPQAATGLLIQ